MQHWKETVRHFVHRSLREQQRFVNKLIMPSDKTKTSAAEAASDEKFMQVCVNKAAEVLKKQFKQLRLEFIQDLKSNYDAELAALKAEIIELKKSQAFIATQYDEIIEVKKNQSLDFKILENKYDELKIDHIRFKATNEEQSEELMALREKTADLNKKTTDEAVKLDGVDQYSRRQNLEFQGIPVTETENVIEIVSKVCKLVGVEVNENDISIAHRLPPKRFSKVGDSPAIIARFINRNLRNKIYSKRIIARRLETSCFPISGMTKLFINENLTQERKRLLWLTKQSAKSANYLFIWTMNGKIYVRKNSDSPAIMIQSENDLSKLNSDSSAIMNQSENNLSKL